MKKGVFLEEVLSPALYQLVTVRPTQISANRVETMVFGCHGAAYRVICEVDDENGAMLITAVSVLFAFRKKPADDLLKVLENISQRVGEGFSVGLFQEGKRTPYLPKVSNELLDIHDLDETDCQNAVMRVVGRMDQVIPLYQILSSGLIPNQRELLLAIDLDETQSRPV